MKVRGGLDGKGFLWLETALLEEGRGRLGRAKQSCAAVKVTQDGASTGASGSH